MAEAKLNKRVILTVSTGRSGTSYLAYKLGHLRNTSTFHEPFPRFNNHLQESLKDSEKAKRFLLEEKIPFINQQKGNIYIETSHFFCQAYFHALLDLNIVPDLILLKRDPLKIATSLYNLDTIPGSDDNYLGYQFNQCIKLKEGAELHPFQKCLLYCYEIFERQKRYKDIVEAKGGKTVFIELSDLNNPDSFNQLRKELNLPGYDLYGTLKNVYRKIFPLVTNTKKDQKHGKEISREKAKELQSRLEDLIVYPQKEAS